MYLSSSQVSIIDLALKNLDYPIFESANFRKSTYLNRIMNLSQWNRKILIVRMQKFPNQL